MMRKLIDLAGNARDCAYAPYSGFKVGAALMTLDGRVFSGVNVENASYGLTMCAERVAVYQAVTACCREIAAIAVVTDAEEPAPPCGACRQVLFEFGPDMNVVIANTQGKYIETTLRDLLPRAFDKKMVLEEKRQESPRAT